MDQNLYTHLRAAFRLTWKRIAIEAWNADGSRRSYSWRDLEQGSARIANLLASPSCLTGSHRGPGREAGRGRHALPATLRTGLVFLPLQHGLPARRDGLTYRRRRARSVCTPANFGRISKLAFQRGSAHVHAGRGRQRQPGRTRLALQRSAVAGRARGA